MELDVQFLSLTLLPNASRRMEGASGVDTLTLQGLHHGSAVEAEVETTHTREWRRSPRIARSATAVKDMRGVL